MASSPQAQWVVDAIAGDTQAFGRLVQAHAPAVCAITLAITRDPHTSEEVAQDVFLTAWTRLPDLKNPASFGPWLRQISRNRSRESLRATRRRGRRTTLDNAAVDQALSPDHPERRFLDAEEQRVLDEALDALPDETREVLVLYYREGRSVMQVASLLELSEPAVRKRLSRARQLLRDEVRERFAAVAVRTLPGAALTVAVISSLPARSAAGLAAGTQLSTVIAASAVATVGLGLVLAGLLWRGSSTASPPATGSLADVRTVTAEDAPSPQDDAAAEPSDTAVPEAESPGQPVAPAHIQLVTLSDRNSEAHVMNPVFGPRGQYLAYELNRLAGRVDLVLTSVLGEGEDRMLQLPGAGGLGGQPATLNPTWHPQQIVVFEGSVRGSEARLYYHQPGAGAAVEMLSHTELPGDLRQPALSADGNTMALVRIQYGQGDLFLRETSTGRLTQLTDTPESEGNPVFASPTELLFSREVDGQHDLFVQVLPSGPTLPVAKGPADQIRPAPAAQGGWVFFERTEGGPWHLISVSRTGERTELATGVRLPHRAPPAMSPDGRWVAFSWDDPERTDQVEFVRCDGSVRRTLKIDQQAAGEPALGRVGGRLHLAYTALPADAPDWRGLHLRDVGDLLGE